MTNYNHSIISPTCKDRAIIVPEIKLLVSKICDYLAKQKGVEVEGITFEFVLGQNSKWYLAHIVQYEAELCTLARTFDAGATRPQTTKLKRRPKKLRKRSKSATIKTKKKSRIFNNRSSVSIKTSVTPKFDHPPRVDVTDHTQQCLE